MEPLLLNRELAQRIELSEAKAAASAAETMEKLEPGRAALARIAGGYAIYCGPQSPVTQAIGLCLDGSISEVEFDRLEHFYSSRNEPVRIEACPLADGSLFEHMGGRGYRVAEFSNVMARRLDASEDFSFFGQAITIDRVSPSQIDPWYLTVARGFSEGAPVSQEILDVMRVFALAPENECYLARVDGRIAGGATLSLRGGVAGLFGASTLPEFRNRGVHTALLNARLARAAGAGCDIAACLALPGSSSQRNILRRGFQVLYTRVKFEKDWNSK
jgi:GNAT superfamily N-acetyltransferase